MYILGISEAGHNAAACLFHNGKLLNFVEEERLTRVKASPNTYPIKATLFCLQNNNITLKDVSFIAVGWGVPKYMGYMQNFYQSLDERYTKDETTKMTEKLILERFDETALKFRLTRDFRRNGYYGELPPLVFVDHHLAHAASSFYCSGFESATVLTIDAAGEDIATSIWSGNGLELKLTESYQLPHSLGWFYSAITEYLGFQVNNHEGKVMGLAPYGNENDKVRKVLERMLSFSNGRYEINPYYIFYGKHSFGERFTDKLVQELGRPRRKNEPLESYHKDVAYVAQKILEETVINLIQSYAANHGSDISRLCLAGGVAMNCSLNGILATLDGISQIFIQPASNDAGTALGAALYVCKQNGFDPRFKMTHAGWGPSYDNDLVSSILKTAKVKYKTLSDDEICFQASKYLASGKLLGWFQGKAEVGARALGARSILANPSLPMTKDLVNSHVKFRENWRPFAPSIAWEQVDDVFDDHRVLTPFMITAAKTKNNIRHIIPSAIHVDGTARPQIVEQDTLPRYWKLLMEFYTNSKVPAILNTSFNVQEEPIVCSPHDAIRCFFGSGLDALFIENFLIEK